MKSRSYVSDGLKQGGGLLDLGQWSHLDLFFVQEFTAATGMSRWKLVYKWLGSMGEITN